jgi:hypothetical protein
MMCDVHGICDECGIECDSVQEDQGIGSYEYWGSVSVHHDYCDVSPCCGAKVVEGGNTLLRISEHTARRDHQKGGIKKGDRYKIIVTRCWRKHGPRWILTRKFKTNSPVPLFNRFNFLKSK